MNKKNFVMPEMEIELFSVVDVITTSVGDGGEDDWSAGDF